MSHAKRGIAAVLILLGIQAGTHWISAAYSPGKVLRPRPAFGVPKTLGEWTGKDVPQDPTLVKSLQTVEQLDRMYQNGSGSDVQIHLACWDDPSEGTPHLPTICYVANGWEIVASQRGKLNISKSRSIPYNQLVLQRDGRYVQVAYWYQIGPQAYIDRDGLRDARRQLWGRAEWPPVTKVLLHRVVPAQNTPSDALKDLATQLAVTLRNS